MKYRLAFLLSAILLICIITVASAVDPNSASGTKQTAAVMKAYLFQSKVRYFRKHHGALAASAMRVVFATSILGRRVAHSVRGRAEASALWAEVWSHFVKETRPASQ